MAYDLTATTNGTYRLLGNKQYIYNSSATRWERVVPTAPDATITIDYSGADTGAQVVVGQLITATITWNQPVSTSEFTQAMLSFNPSAASSNVAGFTQVSSAVYRFTFSFSGAFCQFYIPANSVTINNSNNLDLYSPVVPGAYLPYAIMSVVQKTTGNSTYTVYAFNDPNFSNATRYFTVAASGTTASNAANRRIKLTFANGSGSVSTTTTFVSTDITKTSYGSNSITTFTTAGPYTTVTGTTASAGTDITRYIEMYPSSTYVNTNSIQRFNIAAGAYTDNGTLNVAVTPIYFGYFPTASISLGVTTVRKSGNNISKIQIKLDHFVSLVSVADISKITSSYGTFSSLAIDTTDPSGTSYSVTFTPTVATGSMSVSFAAGAFTIPAGTATALNGITLTPEPTGSTVVPWSSQRQSGVQSIGPGSSTIVISYGYTTYPANAATGFAGSGYVITPANINEYVDTTKTIKIYRDASSSSGGTLLSTINAPFPNNTETNTITAVTAGTGGITLGTTTSGNTIPANSIITLPSNWPNVGGLTAGASYFVVSGSSTSYVLGQYSATALTTTTLASNISANNTIQISRYNNSLSSAGATTTITGITTTSGGTITVAAYNVFSVGQYFITASSWAQTNYLAASTTYYILSGSGYDYIISASQGGAPITFSTAQTFSSGNSINYPSAIGVTLPALLPSTTYYVETDASAYRDNYGNLNSAIVTSFTTGAATPNHQIYTADGTYSFQVPAFVSSICVLIVGKGETKYICCTGGLVIAEGGGGGGGLTYRNDIPVTPGEVLTVSMYEFVSGYYRYAIKRGSTVLASAGAGGYTLSGYSTGAGGLGGANDTYNSGYTVGGGNGGSGGSPGLYDTSSGTIGSGGGGGAGGYSGNGGNGGAASTTTTTNNGAAGSGGGGGGGASGRYLGTVGNITDGGNGGGVGIYGSGTSGSGGSGATGSYGQGANATAGSGGSGMLYGGGTGGVGSGANPGTTSGAIRILWGTGRSFPSTNVSTATG